jgi:hypothetical protein
MVAQQRAGGMHQAVGADDVLAQEDLVRGMRGVSLALIDERRDGVAAVVHVVRGAQDAVRTGLVGGAGQHHEAQLRRQVVGRAELPVGARHQRVVRRQRHVDDAAAAL